MLKKVATALAVAAVVVLAVTLAALLPTVRLALAQSGTPIATSSPAQAPAPPSPSSRYSVPCHGNSAREPSTSGSAMEAGSHPRLGELRPPPCQPYNHTDQVYGQAGDDFIYVDDGDTLDTAGGGSGYDWCYVDARIEAANTCDKVEVR